MKTLCGHPILIQSKGHRGCCKKCYEKYLKQVIRGKTTWEQLISEGKVTDTNQVSVDFRKGNVKKV